VGLRDEILEQPAVVERLIRESGPRIAAIAASISGRAIDTVVIAARGTSDHAAIYAQYVFGVRHRLPVALAAPSILSLYGVEPRFGRSLVIGISQSGASPDVVGIVAAARRQGAPTIAITNVAGSPLAAQSEFVIDLGAGEERAVAATKTYTAELAAIALLSAALRATSGGSRVDRSEKRPADGGAAGAVAEADARAQADVGGETSDDATALAAIPAAISAALLQEDAARSAAQGLAAMASCTILGRGFEYATVREWALKLKELAYVTADPYSAADFQHGPIALVEPKSAVLIVAPSGRGATDIATLVPRLASYGAELLVISDRDEVRALGRHALALPTGVPEWLMPIVSIVPAQLFALHLAIARGADPEAPRHLTKVTATR
jgi:glucosamine--fructose-6-phosphate aminotransferase (isomerizing)